MKVLFIDTTHSYLPQLLEQAGFTCTYLPYKTKEEYYQVISEYDGIVIRSKFFIDAQFLDKAPRLRFIGRVGSGMENIDTEAAQRRGIVCLNSPEGNRDAVAEHAIGMLLTLFNNIKKADIEVRNGIWLREENRGEELGAKTVGIIGFGNVGSSFAAKLSGFGCKILAYDKYKNNYAPDYVHEVDVETLCSEADIISFHVPLTNETKYMGNKHMFDKLREGAYIINTSRGKVVNTADLITAMKAGKIKGACLDVVEYEQVSFENLSVTNPDFKWLCNSNQVILTPHIAGWTHQSNIKLSAVLAEKIIQLFKDTTN